MLEGNRFHVTYARFEAMLGFDVNDRRKAKIDTFEPQDDAHMSFMYDRRYGPVRYGTTSGLKPNYRVLKNIFRMALTPKIGDASSILATTKSILCAMREDAPPFSVFHLL